MVAFSCDEQLLLLHKHFRGGAVPSASSGKLAARSSLTLSLMLKGSVPPRCLSASLEACVGVYAVHLVLFMLFPLLRQAGELAVGPSLSLSLMLKGSVPPRSLPASLEACVSEPAARPLLCRLFRRCGELETRSSLSLSLMLLSPAGMSVPPRPLSALLEACVGKPAARPLLWRLFRQARKP